jgi:hypothetical protein
MVWIRGREVTIKPTDLSLPAAKAANWALGISMVTALLVCKLLGRMSTTVPDLIRADLWWIGTEGALSRRIALAGSYAWPAAFVLAVSTASATLQWPTRHALLVTALGIGMAAIAAASRVFQAVDLPAADGAVVAGVGSARRFTGRNRMVRLARCGPHPIFLPAPPERTPPTPQPLSAAGGVPHPSATHTPAPPPRANLP